MADEGVKVAVRVRPFAGYEKDRGAKCIVEMNGAQTIVRDPETGKKKPYTFDYSYNSFVDKDAGNYASNDTVYDDLGRGVLENAWNGFNCCLFAYGQTGAGKSYSMMGYGEDKGIIPKAMTEMFQRIEGNSTDGIEFHVKVSMMEIYNEKIRDLFSSTPPPKGGLKVRTHPKKGTYVGNLSENAVSTYQQVEAWMERGSAARTVASTNMNATSSRAHTVFCVTFSQIKVNPDTKKKTAKVANINLIDLAGSERASATGATGDRLKEGANINKSLSALGNVINALAKQAKGGKKSKVKVPYRDSTLTMLLKNSLGGNSKTIMIAAISPADVNYKETVGTLMYADRAKQIKNKAIVNEDPTEKLVRGMKEEIEALRKMLAEQGGDRRGSMQPAQAPVITKGMSKEEEQKLKGEYDTKHKAEMEELRQEMQEKMKALNEQEQSWEDRLKEAQVMAQAQIEQLQKAGVVQGQEKERLKKEAEKCPHILNLNEDPLMSGVVLYLLRQGQSLIGRKDAAAKQDVVLTGLSIEKEHAKVMNTDGKVIIMTMTDTAKVIVNGHRISGSSELNHNDRLVIGNNHIFRFVDPDKAEKSKVDEETAMYDYAFAMREMNEKLMETLTAGERAARETAEREAKAMEAKMASLERSMEIEKEKMAGEKQEQRKLFEMQQKQMEEDLAMREEALLQASKSEEERQKLQEEDTKLRNKIKASKLEYERQKRQIEERQKQMEEKLRKQIEITGEEKRAKEKERRDRQKLDEQLIAAIPKINEANAIAEELSKPIAFSIKLLASDMTGSPNKSRAVSKTKSSVSILDSNIGINVEFTDHRQPAVVWEMAKFDNRLYIMRDMYNAFADVYSRELSLLAEAYSPENDPFWDPPEPQLIGKALIYMDSLSFLLEIEEGTPVIDFKGKQQGELLCEMIPLKVGNKSLVDDYEEHELEQYGGELLELEIRMVGAKGIPHQLSNSVFLRYSFFENKLIEIPPSSGKSMAPHFNFTETVQVEITEEFIGYVKDEPFEIEVWGSPDEIMYSVGATADGEKSYSNMTTQELVQELEKEKNVRKEAETRLAELESKGASKDKEDLVNEIEELKKQLQDAKKSASCLVQ